MGCSCDGKSSRDARDDDGKEKHQVDQPCVEERVKEMEMNDA